MFNLGSKTLSERLVSVKQEVTTIKNGVISRESHSWSSDSEIDDDSPSKREKQPLLKKKDDDSKGVLAGLLTKIFGDKIPEGLEDYFSDDSDSDQPEAQRGKSPSVDKQRTADKPREQPPGQQPSLTGVAAPNQIKAPEPKPQSGPTPAQQTAIDGNSTDLPTPDEKAPPGMTVAKINELNGGILGHLGNNQDVKKDVLDKDGKKTGDESIGHLRDVLAKDPNVHGNIDTDPDAAWRAYRVLTAVKNETNPDGSEKPADFRHNGSIGGYTAASFGDAAGGSEAGSLQDYLVKGRVPHQRENQRDPHCGANGGGTSGIQCFGNQVKYAFEDFGNMIKEGFIKVGDAFVKLGKDIKSGFENFGQMVKHGLEGLGDWFRGDTEGQKKEWDIAHDKSQDLKDDIVDGFKQLGTIGEELGPMLLSVIPGAGVELSVAVMAAKLGAEFALKAGLQVGTKAFAEAAIKEGVKQLATGTVKAGVKEGAKEGAKEGGNQVYEGVSGETPEQTKARLEKISEEKFGDMQKKSLANA